jgi:hypothetical protein
MSALTWREQSACTPAEHDAIRVAARALIRALIEHPKPKGGWQWGGVTS